MYKLLFHKISEEKYNYELTEDNEVSTKKEIDSKIKEVVNSFLENIFKEVSYQEISEIREDFPIKIEYREKESTKKEDQKTLFSINLGNLEIGIIHYSLVEKNYLLRFNIIAPDK